MKRCNKTHWFSTDPVDAPMRCALDTPHVPPHRHEDITGRWWEVHPMTMRKRSIAQTRHTLCATCSQCMDAIEVVGATVPDLPFGCPRCRKHLFAEAVLAELEGLGEVSMSFTEAALVFVEKVKELAEHFRLESKPGTK